MRKKVILVTGAAGEIGLALIQNLAQDSHLSIVSLDLQALPEKMSGASTHIQGDILDNMLLGRLVAQLPERDDVHRRFVLLMKPLPFVAVPGFIFTLVGFLLMAFFLIQGNVESSHLHSFILGAILIMGGLQVVLTGFEMKTYSIIHGYEKKAGIIELIMNYHNLERFLILGSLVLLAGVVLGLNILIHWVSVGFGFLSAISTAIISLVLIISGLQVLFFAVFQSMMLLNENNGQG